MGRTPPPANRRRTSTPRPRMGAEGNHQNGGSPALNDPSALRGGVGRGSLPETTAGKSKNTINVFGLLATDFVIPVVFRDIPSLPTVVRQGLSYPTFLPSIDCAVRVVFGNLIETGVTTVEQQPPAWALSFDHCEHMTGKRLFVQTVSVVMGECAYRGASAPTPFLVRS